MPGRDGLMRVFWPIDIARSEQPGVVVGWKNSPLDFFVVAVLEDADVNNVEFALRAGTFFRTSSHPVSRIYELCGRTSMHVLGLSNVPDDNDDEKGRHAAASMARISEGSTRNHSSLPEPDLSWVRFTTGPGLRIPHVTCSQAANIQVVLFQRPIPHRMQYISLDPISLVLEDRWNNLSSSSSGSGSSNSNSNGSGRQTRGIHSIGNVCRRGSEPADALEAEDERQDRLRWEKQQQLLGKLKLHSVVKRTPSAKERALPQIINQINWAWELEQLLQKNVSRIGTRSKRGLSMSERVVESATTMKNNVLRWVWMLITLYVLPVITKLFVFGLMFHRAVAEALLVVLEWRLRPRYAALKDISATAQQVEIRLLQFCYWPMQYVTLRQRKNDWESVTRSHPDYIRFYNSLWLVANDVIIGIALGSYIIENADWVADQISILLYTHTVEALQRSILWLMGWPAGLKLNGELAAFLGDLFLWVINYWSSCLEALRPLLPRMIWFIGFSSFAGASMPLALFSDLLSVLTIHIYSFYLASARIYHWQLSILISLFHLFRGKKHNVLRNRIDSCDYDLDQLLVGTILFTFLFFLLPTVAVFYLNFAVARMAIISLKAVFDTLLSFLNHFPLFALMLRFKDPRRLPGGIRFELKDTHAYNIPTSASLSAFQSRSSLSIVFLKPIPLSFRAMFYQYLQMGSRIRKHYVSPRVLLCLLTGKFVPPINRKILYSLQYSMLPSRRAGVWDMWAALKSLSTLRFKAFRFPVLNSVSSRKHMNTHHHPGHGRARS